MTFVIAIRVILSVSASAIQKRMVSRGARVTPLWSGTYILMLPFACLAAACTWVSPTASFWADSLWGGLLDALGNLAMVAALRATDLSVFGPLNAIRPILALFFGWMFLGESPTPMGLVGILITVLGAIVVLKDDASRESSSKKKWASVLGFRVLGFALSTVASVFLKRAVSHSSAEMTLAGWIACGLLCLLTYAITRREALVPDLTSKQQARWLIAHAASFLIMQWLTILIFQRTLLAYSFVFFQLGMVLQVFVGRFFFEEPHFRRRLTGCCIMAIGSAFILLKG